MSIYCYTGVPGSGKSLHAAYDVREALNQRGRCVLANWQLSPDAKVKHPENFTYLDNEHMTPNAIIDWATSYWENAADSMFREDWLILCIDEAQLCLNSREWQKNMQYRMQWISLCSQSRKYGIKIIFIAQSDKMIDNQIRMLLEYECKHRKLSKFGVWGFLVGSLFGGRLFLWITTYYSMNDVLAREWYLARRRDMDMYDSYRKFERPV